MQQLKSPNELIAHVYSHLYKLPSTGLRLFTVYGPWGRPDMAPMIFTDAIINKKKIDVYNFGNMSRDFTYIDDVIEMLACLIEKPAQPDNFFDKNSPRLASSWCPFKVLNIRK